MKKYDYFTFSIYFSRHWLCLLIFLHFSLSTQINAQTRYTKHWEHSFGGNGNDVLSDVKVTADGGFILGGSSTSNLEGGKSQPSYSFYQDFWVIKLDAKGNKQWDKTIGGKYGDELKKLHQTADGGYFLFGESWSDESGEKTEDCHGRPDFWIVKLDASGNKLWDRTYGGNNDEYPDEMEMTPDGGFILAGESDSGIKGDKSDSLGFRDYWLVRVDPKGNKLWDKSVEQKGKSEIRYFNQTKDKGFLLSGFYVPELKDKTGQDSSGFTDFWLIKLDEKGNEVWNKHYGTEKYDFLKSIEQTSDGGYILGGTTESFEAGKEQADCFIMKLDASGTKIWEKIIGAELDEKLRTIQQTPDKGYILAGYTGRKAKEYTNIWDDWLSEYYWIIKLDAAGNKIWEEKFLSPRDMVGCLVQMPDKGFLLTGYYSRPKENETEGDLFNYGATNRIYETWVTRLDKKGKKHWSTRMNRKESHTLETSTLTKDGGFIIWGQELLDWDDHNYWVIKFGPEAKKK